MDLAQNALISKSTPQAYKEDRPGSLQNQNQQNQPGLMLTEWNWAGPADLSDDDLLPLLQLGSELSIPLQSSFNLINIKDLERSS